MRERGRAYDNDDQLICFIAYWVFLLIMTNVCHMLHYRMSSLSDGMNSTHNKIPLCDVLSGCTTLSSKVHVVIWWSGSFWAPIGWNEQLRGCDWPGASLTSWLLPPGVWYMALRWPLSCSLCSLCQTGINVGHCGMAAERNDHHAHTGH